jgi:hypothetical protein
VTATPTAAPGLPAAVTITRTGGFAGVNQTITIQPNGDWVYSGRGKNEQGTLAPGVVASLGSVVSQPAFLTEMRTKPDGVCADAFHYAVTIGTESTSFEDCLVERPMVKQALGLVADGTPF